jgi:hypothetical protein
MDWCGSTPSTNVLTTGTTSPTLRPFEQPRRSGHPEGQNRLERCATRQRRFRAPPLRQISSLILNNLQVRSVFAYIDSFSASQSAAAFIGASGVCA